jgi:hypothetical protein
MDAQWRYNCRIISAPQYEILRLQSDHQPPNLDPGTTISRPEPLKECEPTPGPPNSAVA